MERESLIFRDSSCDIKCKNAFLNNFLGVSWFLKNKRGVKGDSYRVGVLMNISFWTLNVKRQEPT